jgi:hypothetical protein
MFYFSNNRSIKWFSKDWFELKCVYLKHHFTTMNVKMTLVYGCMIYLATGDLPVKASEKNAYILPEGSSAKSLPATNHFGDRLSVASKSTIARYAIAALMGKPVSTVKVSGKGPQYTVWYVRATDGKRFAYKVKFKGSQILWGNADGRWRDQNEDEKLSYTVKGGQVSITIRYSDGSSDVQVFK